VLGKQGKNSFLAAEGPRAAQRSALKKYEKVFSSRPSQNREGQGTRCLGIIEKTNANLGTRQRRFFATVIEVQSCAMAEDFFTIRARSIAPGDWGDYGYILQHGMTAHLERVGGTPRY
jgi:hypothetical protein